MYLQAIQRNLLRHLTGWQGGESIPDEVATAEEDETDVELSTRRQRFFFYIARSILEPLETWVRGGSKGAPQVY